MQKAIHTILKTGSGLGWLAQVEPTATRQDNAILFSSRMEKVYPRKRPRYKHTSSA
jgi:hypothetical protein